MKRLRSITLVCAAAVLSGCLSTAERQRNEQARQNQRLYEQAAATVVDASDGISEIEAYAIGIERFRTYQNGCGVTGRPIDEGDKWRVMTCVGIAGVPFEDILIQKSDGTCNFVARQRGAL